MGVVYHGFDPVIGRGVAVKTMRLTEAGTGLSREELVTRFQTEARAAGLLAHPNIVVVYDAGEEDGLFYITMEFVEGRSLQSVIDAKQPFPVSRVMKLMEQVCSALDFAHQHNVVHRDIKPANLMLTADDVVKITDFGTAKILQFGTSMTTHVMGTPSYMSPEQVKGKPVDGRSDIFSLGVILYELMTGEKPFPGQNITTVIYKIINEEPIPPRSIDSSIHPGLSAVISRALAKDPNARYQSCHELLTALKSYREQMGADATVRMAQTTAQPALPTNRTAAQIPRVAATPVAAKPAEPRDSMQSPMLQVRTEEPPARRGGLLLSVVLLAVIGYAGYRVYVPVMDLWHRAEEAALEARAAHVRPASPPPAANPDSSNSNVAPEAAPEQLAPEAPRSTAFERAVTATAASPTKLAAKDAAQPKIVPAVSGKAKEPGLANASSSDSSSEQQNPPAPASPSPAHLLAVKLRDELASEGLARRVTVQAKGPNLILSGSLTPSEHRVVQDNLGNVPAGVHVIDDIEYAEIGSSSPAPTTLGWIWVRSTPPSAQILVDGAETGLRTPARLELQAGQHDVQLERRGFGSARRTVSVDPGQTMQITETLSGE
jgi:serine/threonine-protein kinase